MGHTYDRRKVKEKKTVDRQTGRPFTIFVCRLSNNVHVHFFFFFFCLPFSLKSMVTCAGYLLVLVYCTYVVIFTLSYFSNKHLFLWSLSLVYNNNFRIAKPFSSNSRSAYFFETFNQLKNQKREIVLAWVPGHVGIRGK